MKTKKLNLSDLKVKSFVTALDENNTKTVQGGITRFPCYTFGCTINICGTDTVVLLHCSQAVTDVQ